MNERILDLVNGFAGHSVGVDRVAVFLSEQGIFVLGLLLAAYGLAQLRKQPRRTVAVGVAGTLAILIALGVVFVCGLLIDEARPFVHDSDTVLLVKHANDNSFPSDHATVAAAAAMVAALAWPKRGWTFLGLAGAIGVARVFVGVHYPGDALGGFAIGMLAAITAWEIVTRRPDRWIVVRMSRVRTAAPG
jgi:undecaprenyl-diphosphatase